MKAFIGMWITIPLWSFLLLLVLVIVALFLSYNMGWKDGLRGRRLTRGY